MIISLLLPVAFAARVGEHDLVLVVVMVLVVNLCSQQPNLNPSCALPVNVSRVYPTPLVRPCRLDCIRTLTYFYSWWYPQRSLQPFNVAFARAIQLIFTTSTIT